MRNRDLVSGVKGGRGSLLVDSDRRLRAMKVGVKVVGFETFQN